jgi:hypothetical protein
VKRRYVKEGRKGGSKGEKTEGEKEGRKEGRGLKWTSSPSYITANRILNGSLHLLVSD